jgi:hypothetical protein
MLFIKEKDCVWPVIIIYMLYIMLKVTMLGHVIYKCFFDCLKFRQQLGGALYIKVICSYCMYKIKKEGRKFYMWLWYIYFITFIYYNFDIITKFKLIYSRHHLVVSANTIYEHNITQQHASSIIFIGIVTACLISQCLSKK